MAERIHPGGGRGLGRQAQRELRVEQREVRVHEDAVHPLLFLEIAPDKNGREGHFAARPRRRGDHDRRQPRPGDLVETQEVLCLGIVGRYDGNGLGHIHGAPAADPDDDVALAFQGQFCPFVGLLEGRLGKTLS